MDFLLESNKLDKIAPGVTSAYRQLRDSHGQGIYTSLGRYYNHTIFGRDAGMSAKFVSDFDHQTVWETISTLASHQGTLSSPKTQQEIGRIHHELRDYTDWDGRNFDRFGLWLAGKAWGVRNKRLLTYFAADTTATYIRLVHKYALSIDKSILDRQVPFGSGDTRLLSDSIAAAASWIVGNVDDEGCFVSRRTNRWSLPYQTFADSVTAYVWRDGSAADTSKRHSYLEAHVYCLDALQDAVRLLPDHPASKRWSNVAKQMHSALFTYFWRENTHNFVPGLFDREGKLSQLDTEMITSGWTLNASFWKHMPDPMHRAKIISIVKRLFQDDFLTDAGIRTRSLRTREPLGDMLDYHGSQTVWPMFNFMFVEGLRRLGLHGLAYQLEVRILNSINAVGNFPEFCIVDHSGQIYRPNSHAKKRIKGQMIPEQNIAFTVVPALTLAYRHAYHRPIKPTSGWRHDLEASILASIPEIDLLDPSQAAAEYLIKPIKVDRWLAGFASASHILPIMLRKPQ